MLGFTSYEQSNWFSVIKEQDDENLFDFNMFIVLYTICRYYGFVFEIN